MSTCKRTAVTTAFGLVLVLSSWNAASAEDAKPSTLPAQRPELGAIEIGDYCTVLLAPKLRTHLGTNASQNEKLTQWLTDLRTRMDNCATAPAGPMRITPGLISARIRLQMAEFGRNVRETLTPEQDRVLVEMFNKGVLKTIEISATVDNSAPRFGPNAGKLFTRTGFDLSYTHFGEEGQNTAAVPAALPKAADTPATATPADPRSHLRKPRPGRPAPEPVTPVAISAQDQLPLAGRIVRIPTRNPVRHMVVSRDGKLLITAEDQIIRVWDMSLGVPVDVDELDSQTGHFGAVRAIALSPDSKQVAIGCEDKSVRLYEMNPQGLKRLDTQINHDAQLFSIAFAPDGNTIYSGADDQNIIRWTVNAGRLEEQSRVKIDSIFGIKCLAIQPPATVTCSTGTGDVRVVDFSTNPPTVKNSYKVPPSPFFLAMAMAPDGTLVFGSGKDVRLQGTETRTLSAGTRDIKCVGWSADGKYFATGTDDGHLLVWGADGHIRYDYVRPQRFNDVLFIPTAADLLVAAANEDGDVYLLRLKTSAGAAVKK